MIGSHYDTFAGILATLTAGLVPNVPRQIGNLT